MAALATDGSTEQATKPDSAASIMVLNFVLKLVPGNNFLIQSRKSRHASREALIVLCEWAQ
jgi:hypothetical protein